MTTAITLPDLHPTQLAIAKHPARFKVVCCGRRYGKTLLGATVCYRGALKGGRWAWIAPTVKQADEGWRYLVMLARQTPGAKILLAKQSVTFVGGGSVEMRTEGGDPDNLRGFGLNGAFLDEAALLKPQSFFEVIRPALADRQGEAYFASTPKHYNWFYDLYERGQAPGQKDWMSWQYPTWANPFIPQEEIDAAQRDMLQEDFDQEFGASFTAVGGAVFRDLSLDRPFFLRPMPLGLDFRRTGVGMDWGTTKQHRAAVMGGSVLSSGVVWMRSVWLSESGSSDLWRGEAIRLKRDIGSTFARVDRSQSSELDRLKAPVESGGAGYFDVEVGNPHVEVRISEVQSLVRKRAIFWDLNAPGMAESFNRWAAYHRYPDSHPKAGQIVEEEDDDIDAGCYDVSELVTAAVPAMATQSTGFTYKAPSRQTQGTPRYIGGGMGRS